MGEAPDRGCRESASANQEGEGILELRIDTEGNWWIRGNTAAVHDDGSRIGEWVCSVPSGNAR
jgi:hypothetical protein